jgi:hypothetical protein
MEATGPIRLCPCGTRLKPNQGKYCSLKHKGKYSSAAPRPNGFGYVMPIDRSVQRFGAGIQDYLDAYPKRSA